MKQIALQTVAKVPTAPEGFEFVSVAVSLEDKAMFLYVEEEAKNLVQRTTEGDGFAVFPVPGMGSDYLYKLVIADGQCFEEIDFPPFGFAFPLAEVLSNGAAVIVGRRCQWRSKDDYDVNGLIFDRVTGRETRFLAGDGIQEIGVDDQDRIWISYSDEGVFGNFGWFSLGADGKPGPRPIGKAGLNCFDKMGELIWQHNQSDRFVADCYALNVTDKAVYFYFYDAFDLGEVSDGFVEDYREMDLSGCSGFAITPRSAVFTGQYDDPPSRIYFVSLDGPKPSCPEPMRLVLPGGQDVAEGTLIGRGSSLHLFTKSDWYRVDIESL